MTEPLKVWEFNDAPPEYCELSTHGGDEDWVVFIPHSRVGDSGPFSGYEHEHEYGCHLSNWGWVQCYEVEYGVVLIFAHA